MSGRCALCGGPVGRRFLPMERWGIGGVLCGGCYSRKLAEHYPGGHARTGG